VIHLLVEPLKFGFVRHALVVCTVAGALCGLLGVFVTLRGMSYIGHGLSHAIFGGAAICAAVSANFFVGAGLWGLASGLAISRVTKRRIIGSDAAIGVITTASFAFGIALLGLYSRVRRSIEATVFGSVLGVSRADMAVVLAVSVFTAAVVVVAYRKLLFTTFDPEVAEVSGVNVGRIDALLMLLLSFAILASMKVLGVTLIAAALVVPAVIARMLTNSFARMLWLSSLIGFLLFAVVFAVTGRRGPRSVGGLDDHVMGAGPTVALAGRPGDSRSPVA